MMSIYRRGVISQQTTNLQTSLFFLKITTQFWSFNLHKYHTCSNPAPSPRLQTATMQSRYIPNNFKELLTLEKKPVEYLQDALEDIIDNYPARERYEPLELGGLWTGPTGTAYLFLHVAQKYPRLQVRGHHAFTWAKAYVHGDRGDLELDSTRCGIHAERLCFDAVRASITRKDSHVEAFVEDVARTLERDDKSYPDEVLYGRAGCLYLLRMVRHWVPGQAELLKGVIGELSKKITDHGSANWEWHGKRYLGAMHGVVGILTQLVLTTPELETRLETRYLTELNQLLKTQRADGNWPSSETHWKGKEGLVQFCHGAAGFVHSLLSLRKHFQFQQDPIDEAVKRARECIWAEGLLQKEPSLCHGIFGNAL